MNRQIRRVLSLQLALLFVASFGVYAIWGLWAAKAVWFGAGIASANTLMIAWRMRQGRKQAATQPSLGEFYRSWLERYLVVGVLLAAGMGGLKLMPLGLLSGFILGQMIWILAPFTVGGGSRNTEEK